MKYTIDDKKKSDLTQSTSNYSTEFKTKTIDKLKKKQQ